MDLKEKVAKEALKYIKDGYVVGLGSGSTAAIFIRELAKKMEEEDLNVFGIPTSYEARFLAIQYGIPLVSLDEYDIDLAVDGADEVDKNLNLIKGGGGCHTLEKIVDYNAKKFIVIVDESKLVNSLGEKFPIPVEVLPVAYRTVMKELSNYGNAVIRLAERKRGPIITDNGNFIIDLYAKNIDNPKELEREINTIPGVVENGIFTKVDEVLVATKKEVKKLKK
ncbi:ribose-5-phosphate isomerase RpiA [Methanocaldococcus indicus]|uniref:ribose-5-phosphate isomerase RpiA n=1 Tax=Methanocaldococcus indicus TaxID=213231 RepID=UPI003C6DA776